MSTDARAPLRSTFLNAIEAQISTKRKRIRSRGRFEFEFCADEFGEWVRYNFQHSTGPSVVIELMSEQTGQVYLRSTRKPDRGKILFRLEGLRLPANASAIAAAIITTFDVAEYDIATHASVARCWRSIAMKIVR